MEYHVFIQRTARDYNMTFDQVKKIYDHADGDYFVFYEELELYIKERRDKHG
jgi:hypothetical protein